MQSKIEEIEGLFSGELEQVEKSSDLEQLRVKYLGRKGPVQELMQALKELGPDEKPKFGKLINDLKVSIEARLEQRQNAFIEAEEELQLKSEELDVTLPGKRRFPGRKHLITQALDQILDIFIGMGFSVEYGPDIDTDYYNFEVLNFPADHPARDMQDTFYLSSNVLLRTHTSNIQARVMETKAPPIRIVAPGKAYRNETITARSHVFFHQIEGFYLDKGVTFSDLISTLDEFIKKLFFREIETRFRPSYFPFVEPGLEVDIHCLSCEGKGCPVCKHTGWLEIAGAGMIHPEVLKNGGIDPEEYSGYAWGMGVERLIMLKCGINDIRHFTENDERFLKQFCSV